jgi:hypothetical protein
MIKHLIKVIRLAITQGVTKLSMLDVVVRSWKGSSSKMGLLAKMKSTHAVVWTSGCYCGMSKMGSML